MIRQPNQLEFVSCNLCGDNKTRDVITRNDGLRAVECTSCGLRYINPRPKQEFVHKLYDEKYFYKSDRSTETSTKTPAYGFVNYSNNKNTRALSRVAKERFDIASKYLDFPGKLCLEIGCATGEFCQVLSKEAAVAVGIDISEFAITQARKKYPDIDFRVGGIEILKYHEQFDAIFAFQVIEHVLSPKAFFHKIRQHLKKGGFLVLSTPNYDCGKVVGCEQWGGFSMSFEHLYFFTPAVLKRYAYEAHLSVIGWSTSGGNGIISEKHNIARLVIGELLERLKLLDFGRTAKQKIFQSDKQDYKPMVNHIICLLYFVHFESIDPMPILFICVAQMGCYLICPNIDSICSVDLHRAAEHISQPLGEVEFRLAEESNWPFSKVKRTRFIHKHFLTNHKL